MPLAVVGPDGLVRTYSVRAPPDWFAAAREKPLPLFIINTATEPIEWWADRMVKIERLFRGENMSNWGTGWWPFGKDDPKFGSSGAPGGPNPLAFPKCIALFMNQLSPRSDVEMIPGATSALQQQGEGESFNSGSVGPASANLWDWDDVGSFVQVIGDTEDRFNLIFQRMTQDPTAVAVDPNRRFALGFSDGGYMAWRLLKESTIGGALLGKNPIRGIFSASGVTGGQWLNDPYSPSSLQFTRFGAGINWASDPPAVLFESKAILQVIGDADPRHQVGTALDVTDPAAVMASMVPFDTDQPQNTQAIYWQEQVDEAVANYYYPHLPLYTVMDRKAYTVYASAAAWISAAGGDHTSWLTETSPVERGNLFVNEGTVPYLPGWTAHIVTVPGMIHVWPEATGITYGNFEGIIAAWNFFKEKAP